MSNVNHPPKVTDRDGHAVMTVNVPAHKAEVVLAHSAIDGCAIAAAEAWDDVRGSGDASFALCSGEHRRDLINHAEEVYTSGIVTKGSTVMALFEQAVQRIKGRQDAEAAEAAKDAVVVPEPKAEPEIIVDDGKKVS